MTAVTGDLAFEDLTARARIRDAALRLIADHGVEGATIREITKAAGVSGGLVRHHFGSKDDLRAACDAYALEQLVKIKEQAILAGEVANVSFMTAAHPTLLLIFRYLARSMVDGSASAAAMFDEMVDLTEAWVDAHNPGVFDDPRAYAAILVAMETGLLAMHEQLSRVLGADVFSPEGHLRMSRAKVDFYARPLLSAEIAAGARSALDEMQSRLAAAAAQPRAADRRRRR